jgi:hypothetical protein
VNEENQPSSGGAEPQGDRVAESAPGGDAQEHGDVVEVEPAVYDIIEKGGPTPTEHQAVSPDGDDWEQN